MAEGGSDLDPSLVAQANSVTKGMIQVGKNGKTLIDYQLYNAHLAGIEEVMLLLHPTDTVSQEYCESLMAKDACWGLQIVFARQQIPADREKPAGTADAVYQALMQQYQSEFFGDVQQGGTDRISAKFCAKHDATSTYRFE